MLVTAEVHTCKKKTYDVIKVQWHVLTFVECPSDESVDRPGKLHQPQFTALGTATHPADQMDPRVESISACISSACPV